MPLGVNRTWVKYIEKGAWPDTRRFFSVMRCNHCTDAPCVEICPTIALHKRADGIVDFDTSRCIGCKSCMQACPYDALYIDPHEHTAQKCNYCVHRIEVGMEPACVVVCPEQAIIAGDLDNPATKIARIVAAEKTSVRAAEQGTGPNLFYKGADEASLDPLATRTATGSQIWRDDPDPIPAWMAVELSGNGHGGPARVTYEREPRVVYNTDHPMPWGWKVSSYFLTKGIGAGMGIAMLMALLAGAGSDYAMARWLAPFVAAVFLALTAGLLIWDLKRPERFLYLLTKSNPRSWLVRGGWILSANAATVGVWFLAGLAGADGLVEAATWASAIVGLATAGYTAFLFGQAEARDLWQSPTLLIHMIAGAFAAGGGVASILALFVEVPEAAQRAFAWALVAGVSTLGLLAVVDIVSDHPTRNVEAAMHHLTKGAFAREWWLGGQFVGVVIPLLSGIGYLSGSPEWVAAFGGITAAAGVWFADDAFVKAGQSVPLS